MASRPTSSRTSFMAFCSWAMFLRPSSEATEALTLAQAAEASSAETALSAIARTETDWKFGARACGAIGGKVGVDRRSDDCNRIRKGRLQPRQTPRPGRVARVSEEAGVERGALTWRATRETTWRSMTECSITRVASACASWTGHRRTLSGLFPPAEPDCRIACQPAKCSRLAGVKLHHAPQWALRGRGLHGAAAPNARASQQRARRL